MFGSSKKQEESKKIPSPTSPGTSNGLNTLVRGTTVEGTLQCENDIRVEGAIKGKLRCSAKLIIGPSGSIEGEVRCQNAVIEGTFKGILRVTESLNIRETATIDGDIFTNKLIVQSGAKFNVVCKMDGSTENGSSKNVELKNLSNNAAAVAGGKAEVRN